MNEYIQFLSGKHLEVGLHGFDVAVDSLLPALRPFQRGIVRWALERGRSAVFADTGLGKTLMQIEWGRHVAAHTGRPVLILAPLAVAQQTAREGQKFGINVTVCRAHSDVSLGVNVANYEKLERFDLAAFGGIVLDESSILKQFMGKTKVRLVEACSGIPFRLCCTATPAPNDTMELQSHAEFLNVPGHGEMLGRWFINDTMEAGVYRLKKHAESDFWRWVSSWAISISRPSDLGDSDAGYILPTLEFVDHVVEVDHLDGADAGELFRISNMSATNMHREMRKTCADRAAQVAAIVAAEPAEPWLIWCNTNYEADELVAAIPGAVEVRGSESSESKERKLVAFSEGRERILISKPSLCGFGMNWAHCARVAFVGLSYSYEELYQAVRRCWRFGQSRPVYAHIVLAESEGNVLKSIRRKQAEHERMKTAMYSTMREEWIRQHAGQNLRTALPPIESRKGAAWEMLHGDCVQALETLPSDSIGMSMFSPPFSNLYIYSDSVADMGNSADDAEFLEHYRFLARELLRVTTPGRLAVVHCKDLPRFMNRDGAAGLRDFPGQLTRVMEEEGWVYHGKHTIWKDPVIEMQRTKNHGLLYKQLRKDSCYSRSGMAEYVIAFRKWGAEFPEPVAHTKAEFPLEQWQEWASPVWMDIQQTNVLNIQQAREDRDEKHICPLQLDLIERCLVLYSNPGDLVLSPFAGIGSEGFVSIQKGRRFLGIELKRSYFEVACRNLERAERDIGAQLSLFPSEDVA